MRSRTLKLPLISCVSLLVCASAVAETDADVARLTRLLSGEYSNAPSVTAAGAGKTAEQRAALPVELRDIHYMYATEVEIPSVAGRTMYIEWRHDGPSGATSGQRVWAFTPTADGIAMRFHTLKPGAKTVLQGITAPTERTKTVQRADLNDYPEGCTFVLRAKGQGFHGELSGGRCSFPMTDGSGMVMTVDAELRIMPELHSEKTTTTITRPGEPAGGSKPVVEEWVYSRVKSR